MNPSAEAMKEQEQWSAVESMMDDLLATHKNQCNDNSAVVEHGLSLLDDMSTQTKRLQSSAERITSTITSSIQAEKEALSNESAELSHQITSVQELETKIASLHETNTTILSRRRKAEQSIPQHAAVASEQISELDAIEYRHVKTLPKIKNEISLHAVMTNIKWDYGRADVLAGEVSIPSRAVHKKFVLEKGSMSEYEIADRLWGMIEG